MVTELDPDGLYHLATASEWSGHQAAGAIEPPSLASEGFIHCSWGAQVPGTVARHFPGVTDLCALRLEPAALAPGTLVEEDSYGSGVAFPHVYAPIPVHAVVEVVDLG